MYRLFLLTMEWYLKQIENELKNLEASKYIGKVSFEFNMFLGGISNVNITKTESKKEPKE